MAFPVVQTNNATFGTTATTSPVVDLPASIASGDLLLILIRNAAGGTVSWPTGWVEIFEDAGDASNDTTALAYKVADGTEGATLTMTSGFSTSGKFASVSLRITGNEAPGTQAPEYALAYTTTTVYDPPSLSPTGGAKDYLWLAMGAQDGETAGGMSTPSGYTFVNQADSGTGGAAASNTQIIINRKAANASSDDPSAIGGALPTTGSTGITVAIHPPGTATFSPPPFGVLYRPQFTHPKRRML